MSRDSERRSITESFWSWTLIAIVESSIVQDRFERCHRFDRCDSSTREHVRLEHPAISRMGIENDFDVFACQ